MQDLSYFLDTCSDKDIKFLISRINGIINSEVDEITIQFLKITRLMLTDEDNARTGRI